MMSSKTNDDFDESRIPSNSGLTTDKAYLNAYNVMGNDTVELTVKAESSGDIDGCEDRKETWRGSIDEIKYNSRKNIHSIVGDFEFIGDEEHSGRGYVKHHPKVTPDKGLSFSKTSNGSRMWFSAPVDIMLDDRDRTVLEFSIN